MNNTNSNTLYFQVCAPRISTVLSENEFDCPTNPGIKCEYTEYIINGICYWTSNTASDKPLNIRRISPLRLKGMYYIIIL